MSDTPTYRTRYGITTAPKAAVNLLDRSWSRLRFLEEMFRYANPDGEGVTLEGYSNLGLAAILEDVALDVSAVHVYLAGDDDEPGKTGDVYGVQS